MVHCSRTGSRTEGDSRQYMSPSHLHHRAKLLAVKLHHNAVVLIHDVCMAVHCSKLAAHELAAAARHPDNAAGDAGMQPVDVTGRQPAQGEQALHRAYVGVRGS